MLYEGRELVECRSGVCCMWEHCVCVGERVECRSVVCVVCGSIVLSRGAC